MQQSGENTKQHILVQLTRYPNLFGLFKAQIPASPELEVKLYKDDYVERMWGLRFTFWGILLNDSDQYYVLLLKNLDSLVAKHKSSYGEEKLRAGIMSDPFSFLSELTAYDIFKSNGIVPIIEPFAGTGTKRLLDLSTTLEGRPILFEVIMPHSSEDMLRQGAGFAPLDFGLSRKIAYDIARHFEFVADPTNPTVVLVNGLYSALDPFIVANSIDELNTLKETDFPQEDMSRARLLANKPKLFVSAVLLFKSNWGSSISTNSSGPRLTDNEISSLKRIFQIPS